MDKKLYILLVFSNFMVEIKSKSRENLYTTFAQSSDKSLKSASVSLKILSTPWGMCPVLVSFPAFQTLKSLP